MPLTSGSRLGPYEILSSLGAGGMGEVYKALDPRLNRTVAIKILPEALAADADARARFEREARAIAALDHAHICAVHDVGEQDSTAYIVMPYLDGETLENRLKRGAVPISEAMTIAIQIAAALDTAHRAGITHRDLKPGNVMLLRRSNTSAPPDVRLLDFGLAKTGPAVVSAGLSMLPTTPPVAVTQQGAILGTFQYMAPEQIEGREADPRTDIFALGAVVYEMLTGKKAFGGATQASVMAKILEADPPPMTTLQPLTPATVDHVVSRCLAKDPVDRWQSAGDVMRELQWAVDHPLPSAVSAGSRRTIWPWAAAIVFALAAGSAGGWAVSRFRTQPEQSLVRAQIEPPDNGQFAFGNAGGFAVSPDGRTIAFVASLDGRNMLWMKSLETGSTRMMPGTDQAGFPFWSPDSRSVAFVTGAKLQRIDTNGSNRLTICETVAGALRGGAWSRDGWIVYGSTATGLFKVSASGGMPTALTVLDTTRGEALHGYPQMLTGDRFLYWIRTNNEDTTGIYTASLGNPRQRTFLVSSAASALYSTAARAPDQLLWTRGGTLFAQEFNPSSGMLTGQPHTVTDSVATAGITGQVLASVSSTGILVFSATNVVSQFTWLDRNGTLIAAIGEPAEHMTFRLSPDGRRAIDVRERSGGSDLWMVDFDRGGIATRFISRPSGSSYPIWSPDGEAIVFSSGSPLNLLRKSLTGASGSEQKIWESPHQQEAMDWSRDGRSLLVYDLAPGTGRDLVFLSLEDGRVELKPYVHTTFSEWWGRFAPEPNPRWVAYQSDESGINEVYVDRFPTPGGRTQVSTGGGQYPVWNPNGRELYYLSPDFKLMAVTVTLGAESVAASPPHALFALRAVETGRNPYDVSPDGQRFLVRAIPRSGSSQSLTMLVNWTSAVRQ